MYYYSYNIFLNFDEHSYWNLLEFIPINCTKSLVADKLKSAVIILKNKTQETIKITVRHKTAIIINGSSIRSLSRYMQ